MKDKIVEETKKLVDDYDIYLQSTRIDEIHIEKERINFVNEVFDSGYGIRVLKGGLGFSATNVKSEEALKQTILAAIKSAEMTESVNFKFPEKQKYPKAKTVDRKIKKRGQEAVKEYSEELLNAIPEDVLLSFGKIRAYDSVINLVNSEGLDVQREETNFMVELSLIVEKNEKRMEFWPHEFRRRIDDLPMSKIEKWVKIAHDQTIAKNPSTEKTTVIFSPSVVLDGLGTVIGSHARGAAKVNEVTRLYEGEKLASEKLTIISDGLYPFGLMSGEFDDEGVPQRRIPIIDKGMFNNFVYDQFFALKDNTQSTGNGLRQGDVFYVFDGKYGIQPSDQISNFHVKPGDIKYEDMIKDTRRGILIEQFSWLNPDSITGKFSSEIRAGYYIKNGEITEPIKGGLIIGNIFDMIQNIEGISDESVITSGSNILAGVCPYIAFRDVQVAGN
jgi:predicted Zn-dependent protease